MKNYDPNIYNGTHIVRVTFQEFDAVGHVSFKVGGNCRGKAILEMGLSVIEEDMEPYTENDCQFTYDEDNDCYTAVLSSLDGKKEEECEWDEREVENAIVAVEIVDYLKKN